MIMVTGHKGFIARNIAENIKVLTPDFNMLNYNCLKEYIRDNKVTTIIHCALTHDLYRNMAMLVNVLRLPVKRIITFGSGAEFHDYPKAPDYKRFKEIQSKLIKGDSRVTNLILYGVYGKYENVNETFISKAIVETLKNKKFHVKGNRTMSYLYIDDLIKVVKHFTRFKGQHQTYEVVPWKTITLREIIKLITKNYTIGKLTDKPYIGNSHKLTEEIPNLEFTPIEKGIKNLTKYYANIYNIN